MRGRVLVLCIALVSESLSTGLARAQSGGADAERLVHDGVELRREGQDEKALEAFERAYAIAPSPRVRAQIALAQQALGRWMDAERSLADALAAREDAWIAKNRPLLEAAQATIDKHLAWLEVATTPAGAEVLLNGAPAPGNGAAARVVAGVVVVDVRADGFVPVRRTLDIPAESRAREVVDLVRVAAPANEPPPPSPVVGPSVERPSPPSSPPRSSAAAWISAAAAAALAGGGAVALVVRENNAAVYNDDTRCLYGPLSRDERCGDYRSTALTAQWLAVGAFVGAGIAAGASAWLFLADGARGTTRSASVRCAPTGPGVTCSGAF